MLGSFPGVASLQAGDYYAHPRNQFWPIVSAVLGRDLTQLPFESRYELLQAGGVGLWDVIQDCERVGSLDQAIRDEQAANLGQMQTMAPDLQYLLLNGRKAQQGARRALDATQRKSLTLIDLPSTSPAHAAMSREEKLAYWRAALQLALSAPTAEQE